jgi:hypothetical protein
VDLGHDRFRLFFSSSSSKNEKKDFADLGTHADISLGVLVLVEFELNRFSFGLVLNSYIENT